MRDRTSNAAFAFLLTLVLGLALSFCLGCCVKTTNVYPRPIPYAN